MWLDDTYLKAQTGKHFSDTVTVHIGAVQNKEMLLSPWLFSLYSRM